MRYLATADLPTAVGPARTITCGRCEEEDEGKDDGGGGRRTFSFVVKTFYQLRTNAIDI